MKRIFGIVMMILLLSAFTSCQVHWFGKSVEVPWWMIAVPVCLVLAAAHSYLVTRKYKCPVCGEVFFPKWYEISSWVHWGDERVVKCPHCQRRGFCGRARKE